MNFFNNFIRKKKNTADDNFTENTNSITVSDGSLDLDFSIRNYAKESFSVLIVKPFSRYILKIMKATSFLITGILSGSIIAFICFVIFMQFGAVENTILSSIIISKLEKILPDSDLSIKSANLQWNPDISSFEIQLKKVRIDEMLMPRVSILPDYTKSLKKQKLFAKTISVINPKINICLSDDFKTISFNPNLEKGGKDKVLFEPISTLYSINQFLDKDSSLNLVNAEVCIEENGLVWDLKNVFYSQKIGQLFPIAFDCSIELPEQKYTSNIKLKRVDKFEKSSKKSVYNVKIGSLNPTAVNRIFAKRNTPAFQNILSAVNGYNLPISGDLQLNFENEKIVGGNFDLSGASGSIKLPVKNSLSLNLGKKIDNGSICGVFSEDNISINSVNISYGNSGLQLTGISVPLSEYKPLDIVNIDGTLSLTNINIQEMNSLLPESISKTIVPTFNNYLPGFKLELFKVDLKGSVPFGDRANGEELSIGQGIFKINGAKIPMGEHVVSNVNATGIIANDGFDIKLSSAQFGNTKINDGEFFISSKDNSWVGKINADVDINDISSYARDISIKLSSLPLEKLDIKGTANIDMKLVRVEGDKMLSKNLPFRIVEGDGVVKSDNNTKELKLSWNANHLLAKGDVSTGKNKISLKIEEDLNNNSGSSKLIFSSNSDFLNSFIPVVSKYCLGDFKLKIDSVWRGAKEEFDIQLDLKDATLNLPAVGDIKLKKDDGAFTAHVIKNGNRLEFSKMSIDTKDNKISGKMEVDQKGNIIKCVLDKFKTKDCSAKINLLRENDEHMLFSAVGDSLDISRAITAINQFDKHVMLDAYVDLKNMMLSDAHNIKNVKGNLKIINGKIVGGACYAVFGTDSTIALNAKDIPDTNDYLLSLSVSNAGEFFRYLKITDTLAGGNINFAIKSSKNSEQSLSGVLEMNDFIVKNNAQLTKLISLSSTSWLPNTDNLSAGFNSCIGNFIIADGQIKIENGRAISPAVAISFSGTYDRQNDEFNFSGMSVPVSSFSNNQNASGLLAANYSLTGSFGAPLLSVKPLKFVENHVLSQIFGNMLPINELNHGVINDNIGPTTSTADSRDPFSRGAFDRKVKEDVKDIRQSTRRKGSAPKIDKKFGVTINRGAGGIK